MKTEQRTPRELGYYFPAEFAPHAATWLSWPHKEASWPGKINAIYPSYVKFIKELIKGERVKINAGGFDCLSHRRSPCVLGLC